MKRKFFRWIVDNPLKVTFVSLLIIVAFAVGMKNIVKDTTADAFMKKDHPAIVNKNRLIELFGLDDPMVVIVENEKGVFNPKTLHIVYALSKEIQELPEVKNDGITSLSEKKNIRGVSDGMEVDYFISDEDIDDKKAKEISYAIDNFPLMQGTVVSKDKKATLIIADLKDTKNSEILYKKILTLVSKYQDKDNQLYVAGEGAVSGYMSSYIDQDATRLNPIAGLIIMVVLFFAFRKMGAVLLPNLVIIGAVAAALGSMGHSGVAFFVITNALPVVLIGISVADSIHILSTYYERRRDFYEQESHKDSVIETMLEMWTPIGLTSLTTMAGFLGLSISSSMPPMIYFGIFSIIGVGAAWFFSITILPALMAKFQLGYSPKFVQKEKTESGFAQYTARFVASSPKKVVILALFVALISLVGFSKLIVNEDRITIFHSSEPIVQADKVVNTRFNGSHYLDILIQTPQENGLLEPEVMQKVEAFQKYVKTLEHVSDSVAYTDYLKQMNKALNENQNSMYKLPTSLEAASQYFLIYSASASSDDFNDILDYDYKEANIRIYLNTGEYIYEKEIIKQVEEYLKNSFNSDKAQAKVSGRVNVDYNWVHEMEVSNFQSIGISLLLVFLMAVVSFRKLSIATLVTLPVILSILTIYGVMGFGGIWLGIGTSMFAAIAIGLGIDFAIHTTERILSLERKELNSYEIVHTLYSSTGRALLYNALALMLGFGVLVTSKVVPLMKFGSLVAVAISSSFLFSLLLIPAIMILIKKDK